MSEEFNYDDYESDLGLSDEDRKEAKSGADVDWYKGVKGRTDRVSIIYFHPVEVAAVSAARRKQSGLSKDDIQKIAQKALTDRAAALSKTVDALSKVEKLDLSNVHFKKFMSHYQEGIGFVLSGLGKGTPEDDEVWKKLEAPKTYFSTLLVIYPTNKDGEIDKNAFADWAKEPKIMPWRFSPKRYDLIWKVNSALIKNGASIADQDLLLECKDDKFQNIEVTGDGKATWLRSDKLKSLILNKAVGLYDKLVPFREMTTPQLREKLGMSSGGGGGAVADVSSGDFETMLDNV
jgi:hypothetical protein